MNRSRPRKSKSSIELGRRPRILYVGSSSGRGGIERHSVRLAEALCQRGAWLRYACLPGGFAQELCASRSVPTVPLALRNSGDMLAISRIARAILRLEIDIVHVHSRRDYLPATLAVLCAKQISRHAAPRIILHAHMLRTLGAPAQQSNWFFEKTVDKVIAVSTAVRDEVLRARNLPDDFVRVVSNGIEIDSFASPFDTRWLDWRRQQRDAWGCSHDDVVVGMVGRLDAKGQANLLMVARTLMNIEPRTRFVLVGSPGDSVVPRSLTEIANEVGVADRMLCTGETERIPQALAAFDILAHLPSDESFGLALVEAMAAGLPTVATDIGGCRDIVNDGISGILVPDGDSVALTSAMAKLLEPNTGPLLCRAMGDAGQAVAAARFNLNTQVETLERLYYQLFYR